MEKSWFKAKKFGWGWYPITWQGFLLTMVFAALYVLGIGAYSRILSENQNSILIATIILILYFILITKLMFIIYTKKGEKAKWNWG